MSRPGSAVKRKLGKELWVGGLQDTMCQLFPVVHRVEEK